MELAILLVSVVILLVTFLWLHRPDPRLPPCPVRPLPFVGHFFYMAKRSPNQFVEWRKQCGDIFSIYMGGSLVVVLNGYEIIKEALVKKAEVFSDRPTLFADWAIGFNGKGIIFSNGAIWKEQRSVSLSILRSFGMGKNSLAAKIQEEANCLVNYLAGLKGNPLDISVITNTSTSNIICSILIGQRFEYNDKNFQEFLHKLGELVTDQSNTSLINFCYYLKYIPGDFFKAKRIAANRKALINLLTEFIETNKLNLNGSNKIDNMIEAYINERQRKTQAGISTSLDDENLIKVVYDLFAAGTETTSTTICWCVLYMLNNPDMQEKVHQEIKEKIGTDQTPTINDKSQLTFLNAVIMETQRLASIVPLSVAHFTSDESTLGGFRIPKGTLVIANLDSVLHDKTTWGDDVMTFRPERFIDNNGKIITPEQFIPFGIGRRVCLGEAIAKMELFLFLASMFQKFKFLPATAGLIPGLDATRGVISSPKPYEVRMVERNRSGFDL